MSEQRVAVVDQDGQVVNIIIGEPREEAGWLAIPEGEPVGIGWRFEAGAYVAPPVPPVPPPSPADLLAILADLRWRRETGGLTVDGVALATDRDAQAMLTGAALAAQIEGAGYVVDWKAASGWVELTAAQILALASAVRAHVQAAFRAEAMVAAQVEAGNITTLEELQAAWAAT